VTSYPNFAGKHAEEAIFSAADFAAYLRRIGALDDYRPPRYQAALAALQAEPVTG
jgi:hypothetical protein